MDVELYRQHGFYTPMFCRLYIEALLVDEELADRVWQLWCAGGIGDELALWGWCMIAQKEGGQSFGERNGQKDG